VKTGHGKLFGAGGGNECSTVLLSALSNRGIKDMNIEQWLNEETLSLAVTFALRVVGALVFLFVGWSFAGWLRRMMERRLTAAEFDLTLTRFFANLARYAVLVLVVLSCLRFFGVDTTSFAAVIAAAGLAIGLALQGTLSNFSAGVMLLAFRPFKVGDAVTVAGQTGIVNGIELFTTTVDSFDNRRFVIPNSEIFGSVIENISYHDTRRVDVSVGTDYSANLDETREILTATGEAIEERLPDKDVAVVLQELGDSAIGWQVRVWVNSGDYWPVFQKLTRDIKVNLDNAGVGIPFPQMDLHVDGALQRTGS